MHVNEYQVGSLHGWMKDGKIQWQYGTYAFGRFKTSNEAVEQGVELIKYIISHHTGFQPGTLERTIEEFRKDNRAVFYGGRCEKCNNDDRAVYTVLVSEEPEGME